MSVFLFDHQKRDGLASLDRSEVETRCAQLQLPIAQELAEADLVVGHFSFEQINSIIRCDNQKVDEFRNGFADFLDGQVIIFLTTTGGYPYDEFYRSQMVSHLQRSRALLFVRDMALLQDPEIIRSILGISSEQASKIIKQESSVSLGLNHDPFFPASIQYLSALAILCQGYLAVHADRKTGLPDFGKENADYNICKQALVNMRWPEYVRSHSGILRHDFGDMSMRRSLNQSSWWLEDFGLWSVEGVTTDQGAIDAFRKSIKKEWGSNCIPANDVNVLLDRLLNNESLDLGAVAKAFCQICEHLEGTFE